MICALYVLERGAGVIFSVALRLFDCFERISIMLIGPFAHESVTQLLFRTRGT